MTSAVLSPPTPQPLSTEALTEVVNGEIIEKPPMGAKSTLLAVNLAFHLKAWVDPRGLGTAVMEMMFILAEGLKRRPDVAFVSAERWPLDRDPPYESDWEVVPDLAVEVVSPTNTFDDLVVKVGEYFDHDVRQVWLVVPKTRQVHVYESRDSVRILAAPAELEMSLIPGWRLPLTTLFRTTVAG